MAAGTARPGWPDPDTEARIRRAAAAISGTASGLAAIADDLAAVSPSLADDLAGYAAEALDTAEAITARLRCRPAHLQEVQR